MAFEFKQDRNSVFVGREKELIWLDRNLNRPHPSSSPIIISGAAGIGKTALVKKWFDSRRNPPFVLWLDLVDNIDDVSVDNLIIEIRKQSDLHFEKGYRDLSIVIDGTDIWSQKKHEEVTGRIFNYKIVANLIFIRQQPLDFFRIRNLTLEPLSYSAAQNLLKHLLSDELTDLQIAQAIEITRGLPLALSILSNLIKKENIDSFLSDTDKPLYDIQNGILVPRNQIVSAAKPIIVSANNRLIETLKKQPGNIRNLTSREFEILLADLLRDMGWDVELTKQTRDGGADILAYMNTEIGRLLCLVEAKHYRQDRKIGVDLVRTLYGTLCDAQANSAMLVTSSSFSPDAKTFQQKHQYQLSLREYADVVEWIMKFGKRNNNFV